MKFNKRELDLLKKFKFGIFTKSIAEGGKTTAVINDVASINDCADINKLKTGIFNCTIRDINVPYNRKQNAIFDNLQDAIAYCLYNSKIKG